MEIILAFVGGMLWATAVQPPLVVDADAVKFEAPRGPRLVMRNGIVYETRLPDEVSK